VTLFHISKAVCAQSLFLSVSPASTAIASPTKIIVAERDQPKNKKPLRAMEPRCGFSLTLLAALED
jgi:hypothetical protein